jgi:hypothetical protein
MLSLSQLKLLKEYEEESEELNLTSKKPVEEEPEELNFDR